MFGSPDDGPRPTPTPQDVEVALAAVAKLVDDGLVSIGRFDWVRSLPGWVHVPQSINDIRRAVREALDGPDPEIAWWFAGWVVNTEHGDETARSALAGRVKRQRGGL